MAKASFENLNKSVQAAWKRFVRLNPLSRDDYAERKEKYDDFINNLVISAGWTFEDYQSECMRQLWLLLDESEDDSSGEVT
jgi:hypothetical protein